MDFEVYQVQEDGTHVPVDLSKVNDALSTHNVLILIDHSRRRIYNFNGRESKIRTRFIGARLAVDEIRSKLGLSYNVQAVDEGEESQGFRDLLREMACPGSRSVSRVSEKPPPPPPTVKIFIDKEVAPTIRQSSLERPRAEAGDEPSQSMPVKPVASVEPSSAKRSISAPRGDVYAATEFDIDSIVKQFGEVPEGTDVEAMIINNAVYKCTQVQTKIFGKKVEQTKLEKIDDLDGIFTLDGQVKVAARDGKVIGIQVLSKQKGIALKKPKQSTE
nr:hypothetical protein [Candidatus Njordarchaeum guaymaensis]